MKRVLLISIMVFIVFSSCKKDSPADYINIHVDIAYKDKLGNDLLSSSTTNYFSSSQIHVYHLVNGLKTEVNNPSMNYPHDFLIYKNELLNQNYIRVFLTDATVLLELNSNITDTITSSIDNTNGAQLMKKVWYNSVLKWEYPVAQTFTIVK